MALNKEQFQTIIWLLVGLGFIVILVMLGPVLMPFVTGAVLAYVLNPLVDRLCLIRIRKWWIPRSLAALIAMAILICSMLALVLIVCPVIKEQIPLLQEQIPRFLDQLNAVIAPKLLDFDINLQLDSAGIKQMLSVKLAESGQQVAAAILASVKVGGTAMLGLIANVLLIPMALYYLLVDWHSILDRLRLFIPRRWEERTMNLINETNDLLAKYLRGQLLVMFILATFYSSALALAGFSVALPVGIFSGLLVFIPYIGFGIGLSLAFISAVLRPDVVHSLVSVAIIYGIGQIAESFYLTPRLVGERIGLPPLAVIFALLAFGQLFGFMGILLALPAAAITSVGFKHMRALYYRSRFYTAS
jgi:predicted PurR-regulated permease PerM